MIGFILLVAVCLGARGSPSSNGCPPVDPLKHTVHLPHPTRCNWFLRCDHGVPKPEPCPAPLHFNPSLQVCDWPEKAGCVAGGQTELIDQDVGNEIEELVEDPSSFLPEDWSRDLEENEKVIVDTINDEDIFLP